MWYFIIKQQLLKNQQYQRLQKLAALTEVEVFNEPYQNLCVFDVVPEQYKDFMDFADLEGIPYEVSPTKPSRDQLLNSNQ
ncbi:MAG TPA: hypothetical protein VF646_17485 [Cytophagales bacterium]